MLFRSDSAASRQEISTLLQTHFEQADTNNDSQLSKGEIVSAIEGLEGMDRLKKRSGRIADRMMRHLDINQDGSLTFAEADNRVGKMHSLADWNDDQKVEIAEMKRLRSGFRHRQKNR